MELMGFECLSVDQDQVALEIARELRMKNVHHLKTSSLPAVGPEISTGCPIRSVSKAIGCVDIA